MNPFAAIEIAIEIASTSRPRCWPHSVDRTRPICNGLSCAINQRKGLDCIGMKRLAKPLLGRIAACSPRLRLTLLVCLLASACRDAATNPRVQLPANVAEPDAVLPDDEITLKVLNYEGILDLVASKRGKVVVMDAWSTACPPCLKEFHHLVELQNKYGKARLACISLSFDFEGVHPGLYTIEELKPLVLRFLERQEAAFDNVLSSDESDELYRKFDLAAVPAVFVYDAQGKLQKRFDNQNKKATEAFTYEEIDALVAKLLAQDK